VLTNTEQGREQLFRNEGWRSDQVHVIENGVDLDRFPPRRTTRHGDFRIGCVANLRPVKNIDGLMRVAARITSRHPSVRFLVAGDGEDRARLDALHQELALAEQWQFLGSTRDVPGFLATLDAAVLPSHSEGMSNAVLEYMAAGLPVIATNVGANARLLDNGKCGLLVPPGDEPALEQALDDVIQDEDHAARLGQAARLRVEAEYSRTAMIRRFEDFYRKLVFGGKI
jgi:glycosyltransferase involved in cell wall biosynthesis